FDIVHAHDWMTYPAGIAVSAISGKPLIVHVHSTEFDRSGENINQMIYDIERQGMEWADKVIAVSYFTRNIIISRYGISGEKVEVVYNGVERNGNWSLAETGIGKDERIVLFLGRITMQKGPEYFLQAAKKVLDVMDNVKFVMAGAGDMMHRAVEMAAELGIGQKVLFTGFLHGEDVQKIYKMADLYVMPSVSEPFGIAPLEALDNDVPVIISKQSGVSEVLMHALKVDFWDVDEIANKIIAVLKYPPLEISRFSIILPRSKISNGVKTRIAWVSHPRLHGDEFTPAKAGAKSCKMVSLGIRPIYHLQIRLTFILRQGAKFGHPSPAPLDSFYPLEFYPQHYLYLTGPDRNSDYEDCPTRS
ncbi:unnamed protein product, partial [marine sediment metagenome]